MVGMTLHWDFKTADGKPASSREL